ncbi:MAG: hypothetical protein M1421_02190 [Candidatus Eremiobacteraeota bacterium]|nr:hypothetical protein [Candidatus Eremiobacteraeota bacterium]MCL5055705.1 hypothetical protein [Bacillota bacterium]
MNDLLGCRLAGGSIVCAGVSLAGSTFFYYNFIENYHQKFFFRKYLTPIFLVIAGIIFILGLGYLVFPFAISSLHIMIAAMGFISLSSLSEILMGLSGKIFHKKLASLLAERSEANFHEPPISQKNTPKDVLLLLLMLLPFLASLTLIMIAFYIFEFRQKHSL